ncbi:MAG: histidine kinase [Actinomyces graevenitzii]|nr:histidine kinase [Actinomyces graevenitzii]
MEKWTMRKTWLNILEKLGARPVLSISVWLVFISVLFAVELLLETSAHTRIVLLVAYIVHAALGVVACICAWAYRYQVALLRSEASRQALAGQQATLLAAANERSRIAREMHDVVAHSLAIMITMSDGIASTIDRDPKMAKEALNLLAETSRSALADTRRLVGVLREDPAVSGLSGEITPAAGINAGAAGSAGAGGSALGAASPQSPVSSGAALQGLGVPSPANAAASSADLAANTAGSGVVAPKLQVKELPVPEFAAPGTIAPAHPSSAIANLREREVEETSQDAGAPLAPAPESKDLAALVERFKEAGMPISYEHLGEPLPNDANLQLTIYRIAQEALTNVLRYAPTTKRITVRLARRVGCAELWVINAAAPGSPSMHGSGKGLIGMRERAAVYSGSVQAGPVDGNWQVYAILRWQEDTLEELKWQLPV